eukprot:SAG11_NODE_2900_length_2851_cov_1.375727_4_plen_93_part_00
MPSDPAPAPAPPPEKFNSEEPTKKEPSRPSEKTNFKPKQKTKAVTLKALKRDTPKSTQSFDETSQLLTSQDGTTIWKKWEEGPNWCRPLPRP